MEKLPLGNPSPESDFKASITVPPTPQPQWFLGSTLSPQAWMLTSQLCMHLSGLLTSAGPSGVRLKGGQWSEKKAAGTPRR